MNRACAVRLRAAVRPDHLARLCRRTLAQGRPRPSPRAGPRGPPLRHRSSPWWFLVGGDVYTAYTFIAVPALAFGAGAVAFFAVPYTILIYPLLFLVFPRLWNVCRKHGYITAGDFVRGRFGNRWLALAITLTGIIATLPYIALQLVGIQVVVGALGVTGSGIAADLPLIIAFAVLAAFTYSSGLRAPASIAIVKDVLIYIATFAIIVVPLKLGGFAKIFAAVPPEKMLLAVPGLHSTGAYSAYATLALGSALALFLYPHSLTAILSANSGHAIRRNAAILPGYLFMLGLLAMIGLFVIAAGVGRHARVRAGIRHLGSNFAVPALVFTSFLLSVGVVRRDRDRCAGSGRDHVDSRRRTSTRATSTENSSTPDPHRQAGSAGGQAGPRWSSKVGALVFILFVPTGSAVRFSHCWAASGSSRRCRR